MDLGGRARARRREQGNVMAGGNQAIAQDLDHCLDPSIAGRGDGDPGRREHRDPQARRAWFSYDDSADSPCTGRRPRVSARTGSGC